MGFCSCPVIFSNAALLWSHYQFLLIAVAVSSSFSPRTVGRPEKVGLRAALVKSMSCKVL